MKKRYAIIIIALIIIYVALCVASLNIKADNEYPVTYRITKTVDVRFAAGEQFDSFYTLTAGEEVQGKEAAGGWCEINCYGFKGFVPASQLVSTHHNFITTSSQQGRFYGVCYITGYDICAKCCGKSDGITASNVKATVGRTVAMSGLPFGTQIYIKGIGYRVVEDRGVYGKKVDVLCNNHSECYAITGWYEVYIVNE